MKLRLTISILLFLIIFAAQSNTILPLKSLPKNLNVDRIVQEHQSIIAKLIAEGLFSIGQGFQIERKLAKEFRWKKEGQILQITLVEGLFSDGTRIQVEDVIHSIKRCVKNSQNSIKSSLKHILGFNDYLSGKNQKLSGIIKVGPRSFQIHTSRPAPLLIQDLALSSCYILKNQNGSLNRDIKKGAIGSGPYVLKSFNKKEFILAKRSNYYRQNNGPNKVIFRSTDNDGKFNILKKWSSLIISPKLESNLKNFRTYEYNNLGIQQLVLNNSSFPFNNKEIRKAISQGIDFNILLKRLHWKKERFQLGLFPWGMRGFKKRKINKNNNFNESKKILNKLGYTKDKPLTFEILISKSKLGELEKNIWSEIFRNIPVKVSTIILPYPEIVKRRNLGKFQGLRIIKHPGSIEPYRLLGSYLSGSQWNTPKTNLPHCDKKINESLTKVDNEERFFHYQLAARCLMENYIFVPLSSLQPSYIYLKKPWKLSRTNRYLRFPFAVSEWYK